MHLPLIGISAGFLLRLYQKTRVDIDGMSPSEYNDEYTYEKEKQNLKNMPIVFPKSEVADYLDFSNDFDLNLFKRVDGKFSNGIETIGYSIKSKNLESTFLRERDKDPIILEGFVPVRKVKENRENIKRGYILSLLFHIKSLENIKDVATKEKGIIYFINYMFYMRMRALRYYFSNLKLNFLYFPEIDIDKISFENPIELRNIKNRSNSIIFYDKNNDFYAPVFSSFTIDTKNRNNKMIIKLTQSVIESIITKEFRNVQNSIEMIERFIEDEDINRDIFNVGNIRGALFNSSDEIKDKKLIADAINNAGEFVPCGFIRLRRFKNTYIPSFWSYSHSILFNMLFYSGTIAEKIENIISGNTYDIIRKNISNYNYMIFRKESEAINNFIKRKYRNKDYDGYVSNLVSTSENISKFL